jgi:hypothetical protein
MDDIDEKIVENEMVHCNKIIDIIKKIYGYKEIYSKMGYCMGEPI